MELLVGDLGGGLVGHVVFLSGVGVDHAGSRQAPHHRGWGTTGIAGAAVQFGVDMRIVGHWKVRTVPRSGLEVRGTRRWSERTGRASRCSWDSQARTAVAASAYA